MKIWLWIHSIHCSQPILRYFLLLNINQLLLRILKLAGHVAGHTVKCPKLLLFRILTLLLIRHVILDKRNQQFLNHHLNHLILRREVLQSRLTEFYADIAKAYGRVHSQLGDDQDFMFWNNMGKHNLVLWPDYTEEATSYHTLDMSMWGAVRYRRTFSYDDCNMVQSISHCHRR